MGDEITYQDLEKKTRERLEHALDHGHNNFIDAKNLSATLINMLKAERINVSLNRIKRSWKEVDINDWFMGRNTYVYCRNYIRSPFNHKCK